MEAAAVKRLNQSRLWQERAHDENRQLLPGDDCPQPDCDGVLYVYSSHVSEDGRSRIRYTRCDVCRVAPDDNKIVVPIRFAPPRKNR